MRSLLILCAVLLASTQIHVFGQGEMDLAQTLDWDSDSMYQKVRKECRDLSNLPAIRLQYAEAGLAQAKQEENLLWSADFAESVAVIYTELGMNKEALKFSLEALEYARKTPGRKNQIWALYRLSEVHSILLNPTQARQDAWMALKLSLERDTLIEIGWSYNQLGETFRRTSDYDSAAYFYQKGLEAFDEDGYRRGIQFAHQNLGMTYALDGDYEKALDEFAIAEETGVETDVLFHLEQGLAMLKIIYHKYNLDSALEFGNKMVELAEKEGFPRWQKRFKSQLADLYRENSEWEKAWKYHLQADSLEELHAGEQIRLQASVTDHQYRLQLMKAERDLVAQQNKNQTLFWISVLLVIGLLGVVGLIQITKNKRIRLINERLSQQNDHLDDLIKEKDIWMNLMVHDLKAPLAAINGLLDMLRDKDLPQGVKEKLLGNIEISVNKGSDLISQLLEISRLESSDAKADFQLTDLNQIVLEAKKSFKAAAGSKGIALSVQVPTTAVECMTDAAHAQHILGNFVSNAIKFSPSNKEVQIILQPKENRVELKVVDQGPGLSAEDQKNLFQKFKKLSARPTAGESSTGLGLSIVKLLADRIDGKILVDSTSGQGATFTLSLPNQAE